MQRTLGSRSIGEPPCGEVLDPCLLANVGFCSLSRGAALYVINVLKSESEHFLLIGAVRAPPRPVHLCARLANALCEAVKCADRLAIIRKIINSPCDYRDSQRYP